MDPLDYVGKIMTNNHGETYEVVAYKGRNEYNQHAYAVKFLKSGWIKEDVALCNMRKGSVRDRYAPTVFGVGYLGNAKKSENKHAYNIWTSMLERCYCTDSNNYPWYGAKGVKVCDKWLCFENFIKDIPVLPGYDKSLFDNGSLKLDKDFLSGVDARIYSPETCQFVTHAENMDEAFTRYNKEKSRKIVVFPDGHQELVTNLSKLCRTYGLNYRNVYYRLNNEQAVDLKGFDFFFEKGVTTIPRRKNRNRSRAE